MPPMRGFRTCARGAPLALALLAAACAVPVAGGLDEAEANRVVVALDHASIEATKEGDPAVEGKFRVLVTRDDAARALVAMRSEELPRVRTPGVMDTLDKEALVPSAAQEHAQMVAGIAGDFSRTLEGVDGVLSARVHLNVATPDPLRSGPTPKTTASVLLEHRGVAPPITEGAVARLIAGGVPDLAPQDVAVVFVARPALPLSSEAELRHVGPIAVARASVRLLQVALAGLLLLVLLLAVVLLAVYARLRKLRQDTEALAEAGLTRGAGLAPGGVSSVAPPRAAVPSVSPPKAPPVRP